MTPRMNRARVVLGLLVAASVLALGPGVQAAGVPCDPTRPNETCVMDTWSAEPAASLAIRTNETRATATAEPLGLVVPERANE